jgi:hypothetical protein
MSRYEFLWTAEIIAHLAGHDVTPEEFEEVVNDPEFRGTSRSSGRPCCWGETTAGRWLFCVYEMLDDVTVLPVTAYEVPDHG